MSETNQTSRKEYFRKYYQKNKSKLNQKIECPICGKMVLKRDLKRHQRSKMCQLVKQLKEEKAKQIKD